MFHVLQLAVMTENLLRPTQCVTDDVTETLLDALRSVRLRVIWPISMSFSLPCEMVICLQ